MYEWRRRYEESLEKEVLVGAAKSVPSESAVIDSAVCFKNLVQVDFHLLGGRTPFLHGNRIRRRRRCESRGLAQSLGRVLAISDGTTAGSDSTQKRNDGQFYHFDDDDDDNDDYDRTRPCTPTNEQPIAPVQTSLRPLQMSYSIGLHSFPSETHAIVGVTTETAASGGPPTTPLPTPCAPIATMQPQPYRVCWFKPQAMVTRQQRGEGGDIKATTAMALAMATRHRDIDDSHSGNGDDESGMVRRRWRQERQRRRCDNRNDRGATMDNGGMVQHGDTTTMKGWDYEYPCTVPCVRSEVQSGPDRVHINPGRWRTPNRTPWLGSEPDPGPNRTRGAVRCGSGPNPIPDRTLASLPCGNAIRLGRHLEGPVNECWCRIVVILMLTGNGFREGHKFCTRTCTRQNPRAEPARVQKPLPFTSSNEEGGDHQEKSDGEDITMGGSSDPGDNDSSGDTNLENGNTEASSTEDSSEMFDLSEDNSAAGDDETETARHSSS
ncbi:hypothetical protein EDB84DRAFT_1442254 [Lactarius hengduanensis]|nr:hypothetical protein EDB84DRAFT_1442254 [Lactarius hengduanensis]